MSAERRFGFEVRCKVQAPSDESGVPITRDFSLDGSVLAPVEDEASSFGIAAARLALGAAGRYAGAFPPDGTPIELNAPPLVLCPTCGVGIPMADELMRDQLGSFTCSNGHAWNRDTEAEDRRREHFER